MFLKNIDKNIGKNVSKNWSGKVSETFLDHVKESATGALETASKRAIQKTKEVIGDVIVNKITDKTTGIAL